MKIIKLRNGKSVMVDDGDFEVLSAFKWSEKPRSDGRTSYAYRYVRSGDRYVRILMHEQILKPVQGFKADHRDGDGLNNTRRNLRPATHRQNLQNQKPHQITDPFNPKESKFKGVTYSLVHKRDTLTKPWRARIRVDGNLLTIGWFATQEEAAMAYNEAATKHFGGFAQLNNLENQ